MGANLRHAFLGASVLKDGTPRIQAFVPVGNETDDIEDLGELTYAGALGHAALPYGANGDGAAEGVVVEGIGGRLGFVIGGLDTRSSAIVGTMKPGDSVMYSTGPDQVAQVRCQEDKRSASVIVKGKDGKHMLVLLDGKNNKLQIFARGAAIEIDEGGDISLNGKGGASILLQGNKIALNGELKIPGMPPGMFLCAAPITGVVGVTGTTTPVLGVSGYTFRGLTAYVAGLLGAWLLGRSFRFRTTCAT
ncbi:MAG TPA: hypothetical protein VFR23_24680 [Jiangellaceae bacterium]|nr:hypothetical protein [Jiangellaceae bacterium]